jgi:tetratricopeptide (TPR) repeat protein
LATALSSAGRIDEAKAVGERALAVKEAALGPNHPDVARAMSNLAVYHSKLGEEQEALALLRRALVAREALFGPTHPEVSETLVNLGEVELRLHHPGEAVEAFRRSAQIDAAAFGENSSEAAESLTGLGKALVEADRCEEARPLLERALAVREASHAPLAQLGETRFALAQALWTRDGPRAIALARAALQESPSPQAQAIEAWLAKKRRGK